jgi:hypothetical protein
MGNNDKPKSWMESLSKLLLGVAAVVGSVLIPLLLSSSADQSRRFQLYTEILSKREVADSDLRATMFEKLTEYYYGTNVKELDSSEKLTLLRLLALNFHDCFDLKPLFESLEMSLTDSDNIAILRDIADEVRSKQVSLLSQVKEGRTFEARFSEGDGDCIPPGCDSAYNGHILAIEVKKIGDGYAKMHVLDMVDGLDEGDFTFTLDHYDMPFTDNTRLCNETRFAIVLDQISYDEIDGDTVDYAVNFRVMFFPESYMSSRDRPFMDEMLKQLGQDTNL